MLFVRNVFPIGSTSTLLLVVSLSVYLFSFSPQPT